MALFVSGCATTRSSSTFTEIHDIRGSGLYHTVKSGETLWNISKRYNLDVDALMNANSLKDSGVLEKGQVLLIPVSREPKQASRVKAASYVTRTSASSSKDSFVWPVKGKVISAFGSKVDKTKNKGLDISASEGSDVHASKSGVVVYCDDKLKGFGKTVIIDHGDNYQTVYAYNSEILVNVGDSVKRNDVIARVGKTGRAKTPSLHFEVRKNGESRNPNYYLSH
ncbi:MAG: M23 family metallopeptidase [Candidatus Omnitrophota bacterium]